MEIGPLQETGGQMFWLPASGLRWLGREGYPAELIEQMKSEMPSIDIYTDESATIALPGSKPRIAFNMPTKLEALIGNASGYLSRPKQSALASARR
jgi:hypothetical protein